MQELKVKRVNQITLISVENLFLDNENPRLLPSARRLSQNELLKLMERDFDLFPIAQSMADNGYFVEEPLIVIPKSKDEEGKFVVVEGNRRLAALKFLTNREARNLSAHLEFWDDLSKNLKYDLSQVPVIKYNNRDELTAIMGFRHIAGVTKWDPLAKARFINLLVEKKGKEANFAEIARETGARQSTIRDNYIAYRSYLQAKDRFGVDTENLEKDFSVFFRALSNLNIQGFIGLRKDRNPAELKSPISGKKAEALRELIEFVHGTKEVAPVLTDSRQLTMLGEVLASQEAYNYLRISRNLISANALTSGEERRLIRNLQSADLYLTEALKDAHRYKDPKVVTQVERCAITLFEILKSFPDIEKKLR